MDLSLTLSPGAFIYTFPSAEDSYGDKPLFNKIDYPVFRFPPKVIAEFSFESSPKGTSYLVWGLLNGRKMSIDYLFLNAIG